mmetsp:Transcript_96417/g.229604  ORF Transcript_96417/g.229604 Transcript_96417/m.229604 type:complete len:203 (-) Transcript_96417:874-1482(-)
MSPLPDGVFSAARGAAHHQHHGLRPRVREGAKGLDAPAERPQNQAWVYGGSEQCVSQPPLPQPDGLPRWQHHLFGVDAHVQGGICRPWLHRVQLFHPWPRRERPLRLHFLRRAALGSAPAVGPLRAAALRALRGLGFRRDLLGARKLQEHHPHQPADVLRHGLRASHLHRQQLPELPHVDGWRAGGGRGALFAGGHRQLWQR